MSEVYNFSFEFPLYKKSKYYPKTVKNKFGCIIFNYYKNSFYDGKKWCFSLKNAKFYPSGDEAFEIAKSLIVDGKLFTINYQNSKNLILDRLHKSLYNLACSYDVPIYYKNGKYFSPMRNGEISYPGKLNCYVIQIVKDHPFAALILAHELGHYFSHKYYNDISEISEDQIGLSLIYYLANDEEIFSLSDYINYFFRGVNIPKNNIESFNFYNNIISNTLKVNKDVIIPYTYYALSSGCGIPLSTAEKWNNVNSEKDVYKSLVEYSKEYNKELYSWLTQ